VRDGIFAGVEGVVTEFRQQCKVIVELSGARQSFSLELQLGDLEVLKQNAPMPLPGRIIAVGYDVLEPRA